MSILWAVVLFGILIFFHEFGHFILAKLVGVKVLKFSLGFGPRLIGKKIGETEYLISALPLGGYVKPLGEDPNEVLNEEDKPRAFHYQPVWKRAAIVIAGPFFNLFLAYAIFVVFLSINLPIAIPDLDSITTAIENIVEDSPAMKAGLKKDDIILSINGTSVSDWVEMASILSKNPGKELKLEIKRGEQLIHIKVTPEPTKIKDDEGRELIIGRIGISKKLNVHLIQSSGILQATLKGMEAVYEWSVLTLKVVGKILTGAISAKQIGGPILIVDSAAKAASAGIFTYFNFVAIISINLVILNLLPIPVLDGGHLLFMTIEVLKGRPLSEKTMSIMTRAGMALLLLLIAFVFYNDIIRVIVPWLQRMFST
ncbi:MAG: RIP metalloprotease RseP [Thermodesulfovibrionia bacterium]|nr:RIP metalloprotease RseP [Thermodesulfovibrionia bacterium]